MAPAVKYLRAVLDSLFHSLCTITSSYGLKFPDIFQIPPLCFIPIALALRPTPVLSCLKHCNSLLLIGFPVPAVTWLPPFTPEANFYSARMIFLNYNVFSLPWMISHYLKNKAQTLQQDMWVFHDLALNGSAFFPSQFLHRPNVLLTLDAFLTRSCLSLPSVPFFPWSIWSAFTFPSICPDCLFSGSHLLYSSMCK